MEHLEYIKGVLCIHGGWLYREGGVMTEYQYKNMVRRDPVVHVTNGGNGRVAWLKYDSLPERYRRVYESKRGNPHKVAVKSFFERYVENDVKALEFYQDHKCADGRTIPDPTIAEYVANVNIFNAIRTLKNEMPKDRRVINIKRLTGGKFWALMRDYIVALNPYRKDDEPPKPWHNYNLPQNPCRLADRYNEYVKGGYGELIHGNFSNKNAIKVTEDTEKFWNDLFTSQGDKPDAAKIYDQYIGFLDGKVEVFCNETGLVYDYTDFPRVSLPTVRKRLYDWKNRIGNELVRSGDRHKYMGKYKPYHSMKKEHFGGSLLSIDDRQPPFEYEKGKRMWFYIGQDVGSGAIVCWVYGKNKNEQFLLDFYRQLVRNYAQWGVHMPWELECEASFNSSFKNTLLQEGVMFQHVRIEPNNARGKYIERTIGKFRYQMEKELEGWIPRPHAQREANQPGAVKPPVVPYNELVQNILAKIQTWNNTEHSAIKGKTRWEVFTERQHPDLLPANYRAIIPQLGYKTATSCRAGIIKLQRSEFLLGENGAIVVGERLLFFMEQIEGKNVDVYWLDDNDGSVFKAFVYTGERFICEAIAKPVYHRAKIEQTPEDEAKRELMSKYVATIEGFGRSQRRALSRVTVIDQRDVCLNNKFVIAELVDRDDTDARPCVCTAEYEPAVVFDEPEDDLIAVETDFKYSLKRVF